MNPQYHLHQPPPVPVGPAAKIGHNTRNSRPHTLQDDWPAGSSSPPGAPAMQQGGGRLQSSSQLQKHQTNRTMQAMIKRLSSKYQNQQKSATRATNHTPIYPATTTSSR